MKVKTHLDTKDTRKHQFCNNKNRTSGFAVILISILLIALDSNNQTCSFFLIVHLTFSMNATAMLGLQHGLQRVFDFHHCQHLSQTQVCCANSGGYKLTFMNSLSQLFNILFRRTSQK